MGFLTPMNGKIQRPSAKAYVVFLALKGKPESAE
jgi:hypothetical protein